MGEGTGEGGEVRGMGRAGQGAGSERRDPKTRERSKPNNQVLPNKVSSKAQSRGGHWRTHASGAAPLPPLGGGPTSRGIARQGPLGNARQKKRQKRITSNKFRLVAVTLRSQPPSADGKASTHTREKGVGEGGAATEEPA